ncbi:uncharacterized protein [Primulina eburnea]|uniref:uncharacterized protein n=1 Tax=Primulina eburnea TaxID=1245227 RepID=UPI003C6C626A
MPPRRAIDRLRGAESEADETQNRYEDRGPPPPPPPPDMHTQMMAGMTQFFAQFTGNNVAAVARPPRPEAICERFMRMNPKEFTGTSDPMVAEGWIKSLEVTFRFMELEDADRVRCATYLFGGDARLWWEGASVALDLATLSWTRFREVFFSKYFTDDVRSRLRHFMDGLRSILRRDVRVAGPTTYEVVVSRALAADQDQRDIENDRQGKRPFQAPHRPPQQQQQHKRPFHGPSRSREQQQQQQQQQGRVVPRRQEFPVCARCTRRHIGTCMYGSGKCFKCGGTGHLLKDCPQGTLPTQGRVFALHAAEANPETMLLTGRIFIGGASTNALIDSGATHSFISETFANSIEVKTIGLDVAYSVVIPSGEEMAATSVVRDIDLELHGNLVYADLIVLPMPEFDIILGMDWLHKNRVLIDFQRRSVLVRPLGREQFLFEPDRYFNLPIMISCIQARKLMHRACRAFIATIISVPEVPSQSVADVPVVRDFSDVFPDDVSGRPPVREVEFSIDLMPVWIGLVKLWTAYLSQGRHIYSQTVSRNISGTITGISGLGDDDANNVSPELETLD